MLIINYVFIINYLFHIAIILIYVIFMIGCFWWFPHSDFLTQISSWTFLLTQSNKQVKDEKFYPLWSAPKSVEKGGKWICIGKQKAFSALIAYFNKTMLSNTDQISHSVVSDSLQSHESQHTRPPYPSPTPRVHSDSHPSSQWCQPAISSSVAPFSSCPQSLPASESFPMSQLFTWGGQSSGVSALA